MRTIVDSSFGGSDSPAADVSRPSSRDFVQTAADQLASSRRNVSLRRLEADCRLPLGFTGRDDVAALSIHLSLAGLALDFIGAAFLAYDVLYGPEARFQASIRRDRLAITRASQERHQRGIRELRGSASTPQKQPLQEKEALAEGVNELVEELRHWEKHEHRAQRNALLGLLLLMAGFAFQGMSTVLSTTSAGSDEVSRATG